MGDARLMIDQKEWITRSVIKPTKVKALDGYQIWVEFEDGVHGKIDLSDLVGRGVWRDWEDRSFFETVRITSYRVIGWGDSDDLDMCADWVYKRVVDDTRQKLTHP